MNKVNLSGVIGDISILKKNENGSLYIYILMFSDKTWLRVNFYNELANELAKLAIKNNIINIIGHLNMKRRLINEKNYYLLEICADSFKIIENNCDN